MSEKVLFSWSGGKDSTTALYEFTRNSRNYEIMALLTTVTEDYQRISMHGVRMELLQKQAESLGLPLEKVFITKEADDEEYIRQMESILVEYKNRGIVGVVFGDIFLEDLKKYREENLAKIGLKGFFPIWKKDSAMLAQEFIDNGFKAILTCIDSNVLDKSFAGRLYDERLLSDLPVNVDPCGENGEFHTFVYDGPIFRQRIEFTTGDVVLRDNRFYFCDLVPGHAE